MQVRNIGKGAVADVNTAALTKLITSRGGVAVSDSNSVWNGVDAVLKEFLTEHTKHTQSVNEELGKAMARQREESDILWWLFSEHTRDGTKAFAEPQTPPNWFRDVVGPAVRGLNQNAIRSAVGGRSKPSMDAAVCSVRLCSRPKSALSSVREDASTRARDPDSRTSSWPGR